MLRLRPLTSVVALALILAAGSPTRAQVRSLGKGWLLDAAGTLTSAPDEVISGRNSIKGSSSGTSAFASFLYTDATYIRFQAGEPYTISLQYRVISPGLRGFEVGFFSGKGSMAGRYVPSLNVNGAPGASGSATHTATLGPYDDY